MLLVPNFLKQRHVLYWFAVSALLLGGVALRTPALHANLYADDWDHYAIEQGIYPVRIASWDMFRWVGNGDADREALLRAGRLPWWSSREPRVSPLAALSCNVALATPEANPLLALLGSADGFGAVACE